MWQKKREKISLQILGLHNWTKDSPQVHFLQPTNSKELGVVA
jgi:hypothetical protein